MKSYQCEIQLWGKLSGDYGSEIDTCKLFNEVNHICRRAKRCIDAIDTLGLHDVSVRIRGHYISFRLMAKSRTDLSNNLQSMGIDPEDVYIL